MSDHCRQPRTILVAGCLIPIALAALAMRILASRSLVGARGTLLYGTDPFYHLRRAWLTLQDYPHVPYMDRFCEYPLEIKCHTWPGGFDFLLATVSLLTLGRSATLNQMTELLVYLPPVLGALTVLATFLVARLALSLPGALSAALVMAVAPAAVMQGALARVDHHALEPLLALLLLWSCVKVREAWQADEGWGRRAAWILLAGLLGGALLASVPSGVAPVLLVGGVLTLDLLRAAGAGPNIWKRSWLPVLGALGAVVPVGLLYFATTPCWGSPGDLDFSPFPLALVIAAWGALLLLGAGLSQLQRWGRLSRGSALLLAAGLTGALLLAGLCFPSARQVAGSWLAFLAGAQLGQMTSEWWTVLGAPISKVLTNFTPFLLLLPLGCAAMLFRAWRGPAISRPATLAHWVLVTSVLALVQAGYFRALVVLGVAFSSGHLVDLCLTGPKSPRLRRATGGLALLFFAAGLGWSVQTFPWLPARNPARDQAFQILSWLRWNSPQLDPAAGSRELPRYGVLSPWELGHWINVVAQRPSIANPHLPPRLLGKLKDPACRRGLCQWLRFSLAPDAASARKICHETRSRYLLLSPMSPAKLGIYRRLRGLSSEPFVRRVGDTWQPLPRFWGLFYQRLFLLNGSAVNLGGRRLTASSHFRLLAASSGTWRQVSGRAVPWYKVFEVLPRSAQGTGQASPGQEVLCELELKDGLGRQEAYRQRVAVDQQGNFSLALPYPTKKRGGDPEPAARPKLSALAFQAAGSYRVRTGGRCGRVEVSEAQIRAGGTVPVVWGVCARSQDQ